MMKTDSTTHSNRETYVVVFLTLLAAALRLPTLGSPLVEDEAISFNRYSYLPWESVALFYQDTNQHSLFTLLSNICLSLFGDHEAVFRLPAFLMGVLAVPLLYRVGKILLESHGASILAACLMAFSAPHLRYSQEGRGYALTVFLALVMVVAAFRFVEGKNRWTWGFFLVVSGFSMILTLPSNAFFLAAMAVYCFSMAWKKHKDSGPLLKQNLVLCFGLFVFLLLLVCGYFYIIYTGLSSGLRGHPLSMDWARISNIADFLVSPWWPWLYLLILIGGFAIWKARLSLSFLIVFLVPITFTAVTGIVGFARIYIYWIPFVLMIAAFGMIKAVERIKQFSSKGGLAFTGVLLASLLIQPVQLLADYYPKRVHSGTLVVGSPNATMEEARQVLAYVKEHVPIHHLILIMTGGPESGMLNTFLGNEVRKRMFRMAGGGGMEKIILISHRDVPPEEYPIFPAYRSHPVKLPPDSTQLVQSIGNLRIYDLNMEITRFIPAAFNPDQEIELVDQESQEVKIESVETPKVFGSHALVINNKTGKPIIVAFPSVKSVDILKEGFVLFVYITKYGSNALAMLGNKDKWPPAIGYLNPYMGRFKLPDSDLGWQMVYTLSPIGKGNQKLQEIIEMPGPHGIFDGFQSFILSR